MTHDSTSVPNGCQKSCIGDAVTKRKQKAKKKANFEQKQHRVHIFFKKKVPYERSCAFAQHLKKRAVPGHCLRGFIKIQ